MADAVIKALGGMVQMSHAGLRRYLPTMEAMSGVTCETLSNRQCKES